MTEHQLEFLEKNFPEGFIIVYRRPKTVEDEEQDLEPISVYMKNEEQNQILHLVAQGIFDMFDGIAQEDGYDKYDEDEDDDGEDELGLFMQS